MNYKLEVRDYRGNTRTIMESASLSLLKLWCLQNIKGKQTADIINNETGEVLFSVEGQGKDHFPKVTYQAAVH